MAHCECGGEEFEPQWPGDLSASAKFACIRCRRIVSRFDLLMQISEEVVRRSRDYLDRLEAKRRPPEDDTSPP